MIRRAIAVLLLAAVGSAPAFAETNVYAGLRVGTNLDGRFDDAGGKLDTDTPFGGYLGWNINPNLAIEFAATNLGSSQRSNIADGGFDVDGALYQLGVVGSFPLSDQFNLLAGVGGFRLNEDGDGSSIAGPVSVDFGDTGVYAEVGGRFQLNPQWALRASYTWFDFESGSDGNFWGGAELRF